MSDTPYTPTLELTRAPRGELVASKLVEAVATQGDLAERHYLELKGPEDLSSKQNKQKVAKFILGAANRMPEKSAEAFEGCAVMIIGITKDGIKGVPPIEMLELTKVIQRFTGVPGPRWDIVRVPVKDSTNQVLLFIVEPPEQGHPTYICRADGDGLKDGATYIRADGETRDAKSAELDQLRNRETTPEEMAPVDLGISIAGKVIPITVDNARTLDEYVLRTRQRLLGALPKPKPQVEPEAEPSPPGDRSLANIVGLSSGISKRAAASRSIPVAGLSRTIPEERSEDEYLAEIDQWEADFRAAWPNTVNRIVGYGFGPAEVSVLNKTQTYLHDLAVKLHLEGPVKAVEHYSRSDVNPRMNFGMPRPPRKWGPRENDLLANYSTGVAPSAYSMSHFDPRPSSSMWTNTGSVDIEVEVGDLRPEDEFYTDDEDAVLVIYGEPPEKVRGTWKATARGYHEVFKGETTVPVGEPRDLTNAIRNFLRLEKPRAADSG